MANKEKVDYVKLFEDIVHLITTGVSLTDALNKTKGIGRTKFYDMLNESDEYANKYARACEVRADVIFDEIFGIADDGTNDLMTVVKGQVEYEMENKEVTNRSKLRVDTRKWALSKMNPKKYGDKIDVTSGNEPIKQVFKIGGVEVSF